LVIQRCRLVNRRGVEGGIHGAQQRHDVSVRIANAAHFEVIAVDVEDLQSIFPDVNLAKVSQLPPRALQEFKRGIDFAGSVIMRGAWIGHDEQRHLQLSALKALRRKRLWDQRRPASSCSRCQFSRRSCFAFTSVCDGLPSLSKCFANRPSLRAKSMNVTSSPVFGFLNQSSFTPGLPCNERRFLIVSPARGS